MFNKNEPIIDLTAFLIQGRLKLQMWAPWIEKADYWKAHLLPEIGLMLP